MTQITADYVNGGSHRDLMEQLVKGGVVRIFSEEDLHRRLVTRSDGLIMGYSL